MFVSCSLQYQYQRTGSPGLILREYKQHQYPEDISRIYTYSYLTEEPTQGYLKRPIDPYDKPPTSPHFHRPSCKCFCTNYFHRFGLSNNVSMLLLYSLPQPLHLVVVLSLDICQSRGPGQA